MDAFDDIRRVAIVYGFLAVVLAGPAAYGVWSANRCGRGLWPGSSDDRISIEHLLVAMALFVLWPLVAGSALLESGLLVWWSGEPNPLAEPGPWQARFGQLVSLTAAPWLVISLLFTLRPTLGRPLAGLAAGYFGWLLLTPAVFLVHFLSNAAYVGVHGRAPQTHPYLQMMQAGGHPVDWVMLLASAVLAAPLVEELLFRGALLPYLVGHPQRSSVAMGAVILYGIPFGVGPTVLAVVLALGLPLLSTPVMRAIWASAAAFAVMHGNVWPTPVPLFLLALGLGLAARISGGLLAAIVIHALFNLTTCLAMAVP